LIEKWESCQQKWKKAEESRRGVSTKMNEGRRESKRIVDKNGREWKRD
jgi:hypothetical protein